MAPHSASRASSPGLRELAAALALLLAPLACAPPQAPDVLLISIDTLRADRTGSGGRGTTTTPEIDRYFAAGSVFERAVATAPCTVPSVRQFLTGRLLRDPDAPTLAERLAEAGYRTGAIVSQHQFTYASAWPYARGFEAFDAQGPQERDAHGMSSRRADALSDRALAWLEDASRGDEPWFLWLHYFDPHDPYDPPQAFRPPPGPSTRSGDRRADLQRERRRPEDPWQLAGHIFSRADVERLRDLYDGEVRFTDAQVGRVLGWLEARGRVEKTVVALLADHGELLGERNRWDHCLGLSEAELRVPFMLRDRGGPLAAGSRPAGPASTLDLVPTLLALLGLDAGDGDGRDWSRRAGAEPTALAQWGVFRAVYRGPWKLVSNGQRDHLYDLSADPSARADVAAGHRETIAALKAGSRSESARRLAEETAAELERLRSLGYVD